MNDKEPMYPGTIERSDDECGMTGTRVLKAPVDLVWKIWTEAEHIVQWWGPEGFSNTFTRMELYPGGHWEFVMHGPDGTDYYNHSVFVEIEHHKRIVFDHVNGPIFRATIEFEAAGNNTTLLRWTMRFTSPDQLREVVKVFKADVGLLQNLEKMSTYAKQFV